MGVFLALLNEHCGYAFIHIPKSAGKSVKAHLLQHTFSVPARLGFATGAAIQAGMGYLATFEAIEPALPYLYGPGVPAALRRYCREHGLRTSAHLTAAELRAAVGAESFTRLFSFSFVRNPWDRCLSAYFYFRRKRYHALHRLASARDFPDFALELEQREGAFVGNQARWIFDAEQQPLVDFIGHVETLEQDMAIVSERLAIPMPQLARQVNVSHERERDYRPYYTPAAVDTVRRMMSVDCQHLGYEFE